jgi:hypothetical protein
LSLPTSDAILCGTNLTGNLLPHPTYPSSSQKENQKPIRTSSFGDERDSRYSEYESADQFERESMNFARLTAESAENMLKRLGGGVSEKHRVVEGIGWKATIEAEAGGVTIHFDAHDELLDDLIRRFEEMAARAV